MRWRAPVFLSAFVFGVAAAGLETAWAVACIASVSGLAFLLRAPHERHLRLLLVALALAGLAAAQASAPRPYPENLAEYWSGEEVEGWGTVREFPRLKEPGAEVVIELSALRGPGAWEPARGAVTLRFDDVHPQLGESIHFKAFVRGFRNLGIPGEYDQVAREHGRGVYLRGRVKPGQWRVVAPAGLVQTALTEARGRVLRTAKERLSRDSFSVFAGLALGEQGMEKSLRDAWRDAGVTHLVSISGLHLAIVFLVLKGLVRMLLSVWPPALLYLNVSWWSGLVAIPGVGLYTMISGSQPPTLRALAMLVVLFLAQGIGRRVSGLGPLCWGALGLIAVDPSLIKAPGFQLSFAAVLGAIAWQWAPDAGGESLLQRARKFLVAGVASSIVATAWTMPFTTFHFGQVSFAGILANLPLIPYVSALLTPVCFLFACVVSVWPAAPLPWAAVEAGCALANTATRFFAALPGAAMELRIDQTEIVVLLLGLIFATLAWRSGTRRWRLRSQIVLAVCAVWLAGHEWSRYRAWRPDFRIDVLSVGQGDAVLVTSRGRHMLVDTGGGHGIDIYERVLRPYFISQRIGELDRLLLTHPHEDHIGGAAALLAEMQVGSLVVPSRRHFAAERPEIFAVADQRHVAVEEWTAGETYEWQALRITVLHPSAAYRAAFGARGNPNNLSLVLRVEGPGAACALLTGDAEEEAELAMLARVAPCGLLKAGHHGSRTSSSVPLLARARPAYALISAGFKNQFRHPHAVTLAHLARQKVGVYVTAEQGTLTALPNGQSWEILPYHPAQERRWPPPGRRGRGMVICHSIAWNCIRLIDQKSDIC